MRAIGAFIVLGLVWSACSAPMRLAESLAGTPTSTLTRTQAPTVTQTPSPSATPRPSRTLRPTPTIDPAFTPPPTATFLSPTPAPTATVQPALDCRLDWQSPGNGIEFDRNEQFTVGWKITNSGSTTWSPGSVQFTYLGGAKLHNDPLLQLDSSVSPGQSVILTVQMRAPGNSTLYTTYWGLRQGDAFFCRLSLTIYAK